MDHSVTHEENFSFERKACLNRSPLIKAIKKQPLKKSNIDFTHLRPTNTWKPMSKSYSVCRFSAGNKNLNCQDWEGRSLGLDQSAERVRVIRRTFNFRKGLESPEDILRLLLAQRSVLEALQC
jgi:hypothetical protein